MMFTIRSENIVDLQIPLLLTGIFEQPSRISQLIKDMDSAMNNHISGLIKIGDISTNIHQVSYVHTLGLAKAERICFVGLGKLKNARFESLKKGLGKAFQMIVKQRWEDVTIDFDSFITKDLQAEDVAYALGEAYALATYHFKGYKQQSNNSTLENRIKSITVYTLQDPLEIKAALFVGYSYGSGTNSAKTLVNTPTNLLTATDLAIYAESLALRCGLEYEVLEEKDIEKLGMGGILAVNQGSSKLITLKYQGKEEWRDVIGLVGKGITYDTPKYLLKKEINNIKADMGGVAAVLGAMEIIGELKPNQNVVAIIPVTDRIISNKAFNREDVIVSMNGKTIELVNPEGKGILVLADGITYAKQHGATYLVDVATLTAWIGKTLGPEITGAMTNNEEWYAEVKAASIESGEAIWQLPITDHHEEMIKASRIADLVNSSDSEASVITAAAFLKQFAADTPWVHLDIAGTAWTEKTSEFNLPGATGVMTRTLALLVTRVEIAE